MLSIVFTCISSGLLQGGTPCVLLRISPFVSVLFDHKTVLTCVSCEVHNSSLASDIELKFCPNLDTITNPKKYLIFSIMMLATVNFFFGTPGTIVLLCWWHHLWFTFMVHTVALGYSRCKPESQIDKCQIESCIHVLPH